MGVSSLHRHPETFVKLPLPEAVFELPAGQVFASQLLPFHDSPERLHRHPAVAIPPAPDADVPAGQFTVLEEEYEGAEVVLTGVEGAGAALGAEVNSFSGKE